jgi:hypothetical protein
MPKIWNCSHSKIILTTNVVHEIPGWGKKGSEEGGFVEVNKEQLELLKKSKSFQWMMERGQISFEKSAEPHPYKPHVHKRKPKNLDPKNIPGMTTKLQKMVLPETKTQKKDRIAADVAAKKAAVESVKDAAAKLGTDTKK